jgi:predicted RNA-binding Zn-ribbon protein involved in translation (DUF1610 family)
MGPNYSRRGIVEPASLYSGLDCCQVVASRALFLFRLALTLGKCPGGCDRRSMHCGRNPGRPFDPSSKCGTAALQDLSAKHLVWRSGAADHDVGLLTDSLLIRLGARLGFPLPRSRKINLEKVRASLNTTCPKCGATITPDLVERLDFERMECPKCGERFLTKK